MGKGSSEKTLYVDAIREVVSMGGDTDTNGCIVGGILGALVSINNIPEKMLKKLREFDCT